MQSEHTSYLWHALSSCSCLILLQSAASGSRITLAERLLADQAAYKQKPASLIPPNPTAQVSPAAAVPIQEDSLVSASLSALTASDRSGIAC